MHTELIVAPALLLMLLVAQEAGFRLGKRARSSEHAPTSGQMGALVGALLGLLGLLLGFSYAGAASRFIARQDLIVSEANAIGTAYLRAEMLNEPYRSSLRTALKEYTGLRLEASKALRTGIDPAVVTELMTRQDRIWSSARDGVKDKPEMAMAVLPPVNEVIDLHTLRLAAGRRHVPNLIMAMLVGCSVLSMGVLGYGAGLAGRRNALLYSSLAVLIGTALWTTIDMDYARIGLVQLSDAPLQELKFEDAPPGP